MIRKRNKNLQRKSLRKKRIKQNPKSCFTFFFSPICLKKKNKKNNSVKKDFFFSDRVTLGDGTSSKYDYEKASWNLNLGSNPIAWGQKSVFQTKKCSRFCGGRPIYDVLTNPSASAPPPNLSTIKEQYKKKINVNLGHQRRKARKILVRPFICGDENDNEAKPCILL